MSKKLIGLFAGPFFFFVILLFYHPDGLSTEGNAVLASTIWVAIWWVTEAIAIEVTSLLPIILFPLSGAMGLEETGYAYGHKYIFLFIGGFILAIAIEKWNLHRRIALSIISIAGTSLNRIVLGFMLSTAFLSMWISNTATTIMMLPMALAIIHQFGHDDGINERTGQNFSKLLMLAVAYSASIGGMATLIGTPPNVILAGVVKENFGIEITFAQWLMVGLPISLVLLFVCYHFLTRIVFRSEKIFLNGGRELIKKQLSDLGKMSFEEISVLIVFILTALAWIFRSTLPKGYIPMNDSIIAMIAAIALFILPAKEQGKTLLSWNEAVKLPWGILLLFGGGIAIASGFQSTGLASWIGEQFSVLNGMSILLLIVFIIAAVNFLTEITSNLATTSVLLPVLIPLAFVVDVHPFILMVSCTVAASCAFMLPVATAPNAIVFGSGHLKISDMMRSGIGLNLISIVILTMAMYYLLPLLWGFDVGAFPTGFVKALELN